VLRKALWEAYRPGQTAATASDEYRAAALNIETWVRLYFQTVGVSFGGPKIGRPAKSQRQGDLPL
jgi:hypothetical protein